MGNLCEQPNRGQYNNNSSARLAEQLGIDDKTLDKLEKVFQAIDFDGSGEVDVSEFLQFFELQRTRFSKRVFSVMDADGSGEMDFTEFLLAVWNYCTFNKYALIRFAFELYDEDQSGMIDVEEMTLMLTDVYGKRALTSSKQANHVLAKIKVLGGGLTSNQVEVSYPVFLDFCNKHPALLFPAFHLQLTLQTKIIGRRFWEGLERKRDKIQKKAAKSGGGSGGSESGGVNDPSEVNFRDVMKFLAEMNEDDREAALEEALVSAVDSMDETFHAEAHAQAQREIGRLRTMAQTDAVMGGGPSTSGSGGSGSRRNSKIRRSNTVGSASSRSSRPVRLNSGRGGKGGKGGGGGQHRYGLHEFGLTSEEVAQAFAKYLVMVERIKSNPNS